MVPETPVTQSGAGLLLRLAWMGGPLWLFLCGIYILESKSMMPGKADVVYALVVVVVPIIRTLDIRLFNGLTADSLPATARHGWRYALLFPGVAALVWGLIRVGLAVAR
jgi:hypothetical protein